MFQKWMAQQQKGELSFYEKIRVWTYIKRDYGFKTE